MTKKLTEAKVRELSNRYLNMEISFSRMVELLNEEVELLQSQSKIIALVHYKEWIDSKYALVDGNWAKKSRIVEVDELSEINELFTNIIDVKVLGTKTKAHKTPRHRG